MKKLLLIDSNHEMIEIYAKGLVAAGFDVSAANSAQSALDVLDELDIELVITEIALPEHNGLTVIYELMSYSDWAKIPIIVLSRIPKSDFNSPDIVWQKLNVKKYLHKLKARPACVAIAVNEVLSEDD
ncbi:response regulator [Candidatus Saccharibacteria bacterium]|jgi:DNA-binding response OmpR family regulator|nr:response regulator [Candidatus Saccharibacteria bacterium]